MMNLSACFPGNSTVITQTGPKLMRDVSMQDLILASKFNIQIYVIFLSPHFNNLKHSSDHKKMQQLEHGK